ncbi:DUF4412 domain-containing protein [Sinomicrobium sp.]
MKTLTLTIVMLLVVCNTTQGQFLKKLGKSVERAVEKTVSNRVEREATEETEDGLDVIFEGDNKKEKRNRKASKNAQSEVNQTSQAGVSQNAMGGAVDVPAEFHFSYKATMDISSSGEKQEIVYWLQPKASYFAIQSPTDVSRNAISVLDLRNQTMVMYMDEDGDKRGMSMQYSRNEVNNNASENKVKINALGKKNILGYSCSGYKMEVEEGVATLWVTNALPLSFSGMSDMPNVPMSAIPNGKDAWVMELEFVSKKDGEKMQMVCKDIRKEVKSIKSSEYNFSGF